MTERGVRYDIGRSRELGRKVDKKQLMYRYSIHSCSLGKQLSKKISK